MDDHLSQLVRRWFERYMQAGEAMAKSHALHVYLLAKEAEEHARAASDEPDRS